MCCKIAILHRVQRSRINPNNILHIQIFRYCTVSHPYRTTLASSICTIYTMFAVCYYCMLLNYKINQMSMINNCLEMYKYPVLWVFLTIFLHTQLLFVDFLNYYLFQKHKHHWHVTVDVHEGTNLQHVCNMKCMCNKLNHKLLL